MEAVEVLRASLLSAATQSPVVLILVMLVTSLVMMYHFLGSRCINMPPGPTPLPVIGNLHLLIGRKTGAVCKQLAKKYGDMFTLHLGPVRVVVLNSQDAMKEALLKEGNTFSGRPTLIVGSSNVLSTNTGILFSEGAAWKSNRRFSLRHLRDLGLGRQSFEDNISREINIFLDALKENTTKTFKIHTLLSNAVSNIICCLVFGKRYEYNSKEFTKMMLALDEIAATTPVLAILPFLKYVPGMRSYVSKRVNSNNFLQSIITRHLEEHKATFDIGNSADDLIDSYLQGKKSVLRSQTVATEEDVIFEDCHVVKTILDLFIAGTETTTTTLCWALLYMITHLSIQDKVWAEIDAVIGSDRKATLSDKSKMHYTQAVLTEVQRIGNVLYMSLPHKTLDDVEFRGYNIPANTTIIPNLLAVHMNEDIFPNPTEFRPERFLDSKDQFDKTMAEKILPFGIGKRVCPGESLAKMELFLFFTSMLQQFIFKLPDDAPKPCFEGSAGMINSPKPFDICVLAR